MVTAHVQSETADAPQVLKGSVVLLTGVCLCVCAAPANGHAEPSSLYEAESWAAIGAFLFGPDPSKALTPHPSTQKGKKAIKVC